MSKIFFKVLFSLMIPAAAVVLLTVSCEKTEEPLSFAYQDRVGDAAAILAAEKWDEEIPLEGSVFSSGALAAEALISGNADVATMGDAVAVSIASRYPDRVVLLGIHGGGSSRHRLAGSAENPSKIAVKFGTSTHAALIAWLDYDAELVDLSPGVQISALAAGEVDALAASEPTPSIALERNPGLKARSLEIPGRNYPIVLVASRKAIKEKNKQIMLLEENIRLAGEKIQGGLSEEEIKILSDVTGLKKNLLLKSMNFHFYGYSSASEYIEELSSLSNFMIEQGKIRDVPDWNAVLRNPLE